MNGGDNLNIDVQIQFNEGTIIGKAIESSSNIVKSSLNILSDKLIFLLEDKLSDKNKEYLKNLAQDFGKYFYSKFHTYKRYKLHYEDLVRHLCERDWYFLKKSYITFFIPQALTSSQTLCEAQNLSFLRRYQRKSERKLANLSRKRKESSYISSFKL